MKDWKVLDYCAWTLRYTVRRDLEELIGGHAVKRLSAEHDLLSDVFSSAASQAIFWHLKIRQQIRFLDSLQEYCVERTEESEKELLGSLVDLLPEGITIPIRDNGVAPRDSSVKDLAIEELKIVLMDIQKDSGSVLNAAERLKCKGLSMSRITSTNPLFKCPCGNLFFEELPEKKACPLCGQKIEAKTCKRIAVTSLDDDVFKFLSENIWLEEGIARMYRKCGYSTRLRQNIRGLSGVFHEIDVLSYNKEYLILAECSTQDIGLRQVWSAICKRMDIGAHEVHVFSVGDPCDEARKFAKTHNVRLFPSIISETEETEERISATLADISNGG